jgi:hypothetical protein
MSVFKKSKVPVPASTPFPSPLNTPVPLVASRGQVLKVTSSIRGMEVHAARHRSGPYYE